MEKITLPASGTSTRRKLVAAAATTAVTIGVAAFGGTSTAQSAEDPSCPTAYPIDDVAAVRGLAVTGKTVTTGVTPEAFQGTVLDVLKDGIAPGIPMIIVQMDSANVAKHGIWFGMSGSPVYGPDGRLLGAVSYGFSGSSNVAGVTPAADMQKLLTSVPGSVAGSTMAARVTMPRSTTQRLAAAGATTEDATVTASVLKTPFMISNMSDSKRTSQLASALKRSKVAGRDVVFKGAGTSASAASEDIPVTAGGNVAASISYGDVTAAGIGTATAVCGSEVLAFGHPMNFNGKTSMTMHGARAVTIIDDPVWGAWKMANLGSPTGVIDQDRLTAIHGVSGPAPATSDITSGVTVGPDARTGTTWISLPEAVPDISIGHVVSDQDVVLNSITEGHGTFGYTVHFTREDGTKQTMSRHDLYADPYDISYGDVWDFANLVYTLGYSGLEDVTIDSITTESDLTTTYQHYLLTKVEMWRDGAWRKLNADKVLRLKPGSLAKFRIKLTSPQLGDRTVWESVPVPSTAGNKMGTLQVFGGNSGGGYEEDGDIYYEGKASAGDNAEPTLDDLLSQLNREPHNDDVVVDMTWYNREGKQTNHKKDHVRTGDVVDGSFAMTVRGIRPKR